MRLARALTITALVLVAASCGGGSKSATPTASAGDGGIGGTAADTGPLAWPLPAVDRVAQLVANAGLQMETHESLTFHVHAHLDVFIDGEHRTVPGGIGIVITDPRVHSGTTDGAPAYGGISAACLDPCISPLHTHDVSGVLHTESANSTPNTLGQFFKEWDVRLDGQCVGEYCTPSKAISVYVDGKETPLSSAAGLSLTNHEEIAIVIGTKPARIPSEGDFSKA